MVGPDAVARLAALNTVLIEYDEGVVNVTRRNIRVVAFANQTDTRHRTVRLTCRDANAENVPCSGTQGLVRVARLTVKPPLPANTEWNVKGAWSPAVDPMVTESDGTRVNSYRVQGN